MPRINNHANIAMVTSQSSKAICANLLDFMFIL
jgi:hypothetical protein